MKEEHKKKISTALKAYHACARKAGCGKAKKLPKARMVKAKPRVKVRKKNLYSKTKVRRVEKAENVPSKGSRAGKAIAKKPTTMRSIQAPKKRVSRASKAAPVASGMGGGARPRKTLPKAVDPFDRHGAYRDRNFFARRYPIYADPNYPATKTNTGYE